MTSVDYRHISVSNSSLWEKLSRSEQEAYNLGRSMGILYTIQEVENTQDSIRGIAYSDMNHSHHRIEVEARMRPTPAPLTHEDS